MTGSSDDRWENGTRGVITGETGLAHAGSVINDQSSNFFVAHFCTFFYLFNEQISKNQQKEFEEGNAPEKFYS